MAIKKFKVTVTQIVEVELDDSKLNDDFNKEFSATMWDVDCLQDHANHIGQMEARDLIGSDGFLEGYGDLKKLNCKAQVVDQHEESELISSRKQPEAT